MRSARPASASATGWTPQAPRAPYALSLIIDGKSPFDGQALRTAGLSPDTPCSILNCADIPGATVAERGHALLAEIRRRKAAGEFSAYTLTMIFMHGSMHSGELILGVANASLQIPLAVLLRALSRELSNADERVPGRQPAPVILSGCEAGSAAASLQTFGRPILINGGERALLDGDAHAVLVHCARTAESGWRSNRPLVPDEWLEQLSKVTAAPLHLVEADRWIVHDYLTSSTSLASADPRQAALYVRDKLLFGGIDEFAESLQLFGLRGLDTEPGSKPALHMLVRSGLVQTEAKMVLLAALGVPVNQRNAAGDTPLHLVCRSRTGRGRKSLNPDERALRARILLVYGADPNARNNSGRTPFDCARDAQQPALLACFNPERIQGDRPALSPAELRRMAAHHQWRSVLSLLDDPSQVLDPESDDSLDSVDTGNDMESDSGDQGTVMATPARVRRPLSVVERLAVSGLMDLGDAPGQ